MTDLTLINNELSLLMGMSEEELEKALPIISGTAQHISSLLKDAENENTGAVVHLCACSAYYQLVLLDTSDDVTSFKAGDVSYTRASASPERAKRLYELAKRQCMSLIKPDSSDFAFMVV